MLVLGVDPGTYSMGVGAVESDGERFTVKLSDALRPPRRTELAQRLAWLHQNMDRLITELRPDVVAIESPFVARNVRAAVAVGQSQAVAMIAAASHGVPVATYAPREVKKAVTDYGGASKEQVQEMVQALLSLPESIGAPDQTDALAVAVCHINSSMIASVEMWE